MEQQISQEMVRRDSEQLEKVQSSQTQVEGEANEKTAGVH